MWARLSLAAVAVATFINLLLTISSDAQSSYSDLREALQRIEQRQRQACR